MSFSDFKEVSVSNPGTSLKYGSDDLLDVMQILNGKVVSNRQVRIKNAWQFIDHVELKAPATLPAAPTLATVRHIVVDPADNHIKIQKTGGSLLDLDALLANTWDATAAETLTNKTISVDLNPIKHSTTNTVGDILKNNGTRYARMGRGTALQLLRVNSAGTDLEYADPSVVAGGGETNTASNVGSGTVGVFRAKVGTDLQFKTLRAASSAFSIVDDTANSRINMDVNLSGITLNTLSGTINLVSQTSGILPVADGGTGVSSITGLVKASGTSAFSGIPNGTAGQVLQMVGGLPSWANLPPAATTAFMPDNTKWGGFWGGATGGEGIFAGCDVYGDSLTGDQSSATDQFTTFTTDNTDAAIAGFRTKVSCTRRDYNPVLNFRFKAANPNNSHIWMGFLQSASMPLNISSDDPCAGQTGFLFGFTDVHTNYQFTWGAGGASGTFIDTGVAKATSGIQDVQMEFDNTAGKIKGTINGVVKTPGGTAGTPATGTPMFVHFNIEAIGSNAVPMSLNYAKLVQNE
jgi:hypothetical protein